MRNITTTTKKTKSNSLSIIIPAAGVGKRMRSNGPKSFISINGKYLIDRQLELLKQVYPHAEIIVVGGYEAKRLMDYLPTHILKVENEKFEETNVVRSIGMGLRVARSENVLVIYGDLVFNKVALPINLTESTLVLDKINNLMREDEVGCTSSNKVEILMYELAQKWAQIMFLTGKELKMFKNLSWSPDKYNLFGFEIINEIILKKGEFKVYCPNNIKVIDVDFPTDIKIAENI